MGTKNRFDGISEYLETMVRVKAWQMVEKYGFKPRELADLEQSLITHLLDKMQHHDASKAMLETFLDRVLNHYSISLARHRVVERKHFPQELDLDLPVPESNPQLFQNQLGNDLYMERSGLGSDYSSRSIQTRIDLQSAIESLPRDLQAICKELTHSSVAEAAATLGIHRATIYRKIQHIRKHFENKGLSLDE